MHFKRLPIIVFILTIISLYACKVEHDQIPTYTTETDFINDTSSLSAMEKMGKKLFFDKSFSNPVGTSCASCHAPLDGFSDPRHTAVSEGSLGLMGTRNSPAIGYLAYSPQQMYFDNVDSTWVGGFFHDGRAATLEEQIKEPIMGHVEMNVSSISELMSRVRMASYADAFRQLFGNSVLQDTTYFFNSFQQAIATFERSYQVSPFSSKYDYYLKGKVQLSPQEMRGLILFNDPKKGNCSACHPSSVDDRTGKVLFTDFTYDNIGLPALSGLNTIDFGLGISKNDALQNGKFKVPSLRNIEKTAPYFHNGVIKTLEDAIRFYSERDIIGKFDAPEVPENMNKEELGNLKLSVHDINDIKAFLLTLTDGYQP